MTWVREFLSLVELQFVSTIVNFNAICHLQIHVKSDLITKKEEERLQKGLFYINEILYWGTLSNNNAFIYKQNAFRFGWIYICSGKYVCTYILTNAIFAIDIVDCAIFHHKKYCDYWQERLALNSIGIMHIHTS
jgi:hypothetical protein